MHTGCQTSNRKSPGAVASRRRSCFDRGNQTRRRLAAPPARRPARIDLDAPMPTRAPVSVADLIGESDPSCFDVQSRADGPSGTLPLTDEMLKEWPSGDLFGLSQNAGMGWTPSE